MDVIIKAVGDAVVYGGVFGCPGDAVPCCGEEERPLEAEMERAGKEIDKQKGYKIRP